MNVDPPERRPWVVTLNLLSWKPAPPTIARIAPVPGSTDTTAPVATRAAPVSGFGAERDDARSACPSGATSASTSLRAFVASSCAFGSRVV